MRTLIGSPGGEGVQNLLCAAQALAALVAVVAAGAGVAFLDPLAAVVIAAIAGKEGIDLWRGEECGCHTVPGSDATSGDLACRDDCCDG